MNLHNKNTKIILVGYRATGKSCIGKLLAAKLSLSFIDMDLVIEEKEGCSISEMVETHGWQYFRSLEKQVLSELAKSSEAMVIATGGGAILHEDIWPDIMAASIVVWLTAGRDIICQRLQSDKKTDTQRPSLTDNDIFNEIDTVLSEREPLYSKGCHFSVDTETMTLEQIAVFIEEKLMVLL